MEELDGIRDRLDGIYLDLSLQLEGVSDFLLETLTALNGKATVDAAYTVLRLHRWEGLETEVVAQKMQLGGWCASSDPCEQEVERALSGLLEEGKIGTCAGGHWRSHPATVCPSC